MKGEGPWSGSLLGPLARADLLDYLIARLPARSHIDRLRTGTDKGNLTV